MMKGLMMNIETLIQKMGERYQVEAEYLWRKFPDYAVFRHTHNRKWFCAFGTVGADKLGLQGGEKRVFVNVKAPPEQVGSLRMMPGILPAYHMNKEHWVTLLPDEMEDKDILNLIDNSFQLTR